MKSGRAKPPVGHPLDALAEQLAADPAYAFGSHKFPAPIRDGEAAALAAHLAAEFDRGTARRDELAAAQGHTIHCHDGCNHCCRILVMAYRPEALAIARYLRRPENRAAREAFLAAWPAWRAAAGEVPERATSLFVAGESAAYDRLQHEQWRRQLLCAFNHDGRCSIYPVRPIACRNAHALDTDERCLPTSPRPAEAVAFVPLQEFLTGALRVLRAAHNATVAVGDGAQRHAQESVCVAVARLLALPP